MKKFFTYAILGMATAFTSCTDVNVPDVDSLSSHTNSHATRASEDPVLIFNSLEEFQTAVAHIANLNSEELKAKWVHETFSEFESIQDIYWEAMNEMGEMEEVDADKYSNFEQKYSSLYFPKIGEDAGFYIPMTDLDAAFLVNRHYEVSIGGSIQNLRDIEDYGKLIELGRAYYAIPATMLSTDLIPFYLTSESINSVGPEYDSDWTVYDGDRKVKLKARRKLNGEVFPGGIPGSYSVLHLEFCFRKKTWLGWSNYSSESKIVFDADIPGYKHIGPIVINNSGTSSHDSEVNLPIKITQDATHWYYTYAATPCEAAIDYRGAGHLNYSWTMPGIQCTVPISATKKYIFPQF